MCGPKTSINSPSTADSEGAAESFDAGARSF